MYFFEPYFYSQALSGGSGFVQRNINRFESRKFFISFVNNNTTDVQLETKFPFLQII